MHKWKDLLERPDEARERPLVGRVLHLNDLISLLRLLVDGRDVEEQPELPLRYHAHQNLKMNITEWQKVRVIHMISGFRRRNRAPDFVFKRMRYFDQESASWA